MKKRLLAATVSVIQLLSWTMPAPLAWADPDHGWGDQGGHHDEDRGHGPDRGRDHDQRPNAPRGDDPRGNDHRGNDWRGGDHGDRDWGHGPVRWHDNDHEFRHEDYRPAPRFFVPPARVYHYRDIIVERPYGHFYHGYGHYYDDDDAFRWLALTAITAAIINVLTANQERALEDAQIRATTAPVGEPIQWRDGNAYGTVTTLRDGTSASGQYCREFQQKVFIEGRSQDAYGTACQQPDGAWQIVPNQ